MNLTDSLGLLIWTLIYENQTLKKFHVLQTLISFKLLCRNA